MAPILVVRTTGFPVELLTGLRFPCSVRAVRLVLDHDQHVRELSRDVLAPAFRAAVAWARSGGDRAALRATTRARRQVARELAVDERTAAALPAAMSAGVRDWNCALLARAGAVAAGRAVFEAELAGRRAQLRRVLARPDVGEALLLSNPDAFAAARRYVDRPADQRTAAARKLERRMVSYLQRFCAKNETQSFFGPINYGRLDPAAPNGLTVRRGPMPTRARRTFPAQWLVESLAELISADADARAHLTPRRGTACTLDGQALRWPATGRTQPLEAADAWLFARVDGTRTVACLAAAFGADDATVWRRLERLAAAGAVVIGLLVPPDLPDPLVWLRGWLAALPRPAPVRVRWEPVIADLSERIEAFATAPPQSRPRLLAELEDTVARVTGGPSRRHAGRMYADRSVLFEECLGDLERFVVGGALAAALVSGLRPALRLAASRGELARLRDRRAATDFLRKAAPGQAMPLLAYLAEVAGRATTAGDAPDDEFAAFERTLHELVAHDADRPVVRLRSEQLPTPHTPPDPDDYRVTSVDLMIAAESLADLSAGRFQLIVGEVHPPPLPWVFPTGHFLSTSDRARLAVDIRSAIAAQPGGALAAQFAHTRRNKIFPYRLPGPVIELRPRLPECSAVPAAEVEVAIRDGLACLRAPGVGWLRLYPPLRQREDGLDPVAPFALAATVPPAVGCGVHTPRVEIDGVVLQRERWELPGGPLGEAELDGFALLLAAWRRKTRLGLPDEVYLRVPGEPKPVLVDFHNHFLVELADHLTRKATRVELSEALPDTRQLWLEGPEGRHCCEIRLVAWGEADGRADGVPGSASQRQLPADVVGAGDLPAR